MSQTLLINSKTITNVCDKIDFLVMFVTNMFDLLKKDITIITDTMKIITIVCDKNQQFSKNSKFFQNITNVCDNNSVVL